MVFWGKISQTPVGSKHRFQSKKTKRPCQHLTPLACWIWDLLTGIFSACDSTNLVIRPGVHTSVFIGWLIDLDSFRVDGWVNDGEWSHEWWWIYWSWWIWDEEQDYINEYSSKSLFSPSKLLVWCLSFQLRPAKRSIWFLDTASPSIISAWSWMFPLAHSFKWYAKDIQRYLNYTDYIDI